MITFRVSEIILNLTSRPRDNEGQTKQKRVYNCVPHISVSFSERVFLFFFLLVCEILSPVCPPKISFKNFPIDTQ